MSDLNVQMILKLVDQATAPARRAADGLRGIFRQTERTEEEMAQRREQRARGAIRGVMGLAAVMGTVTTAAVLAEEQMAEVIKKVDFESPEGFRLLGNDIQRLSTEIPMAASAITEIVALAGGLNVVDAGLPDAEKREQLVAFAADAARMGVAFDIAADQAATSLARWRNNLDLSADGALLLGDAINILGNTMATSERDILTVIDLQGVVAKSAGLAAEETAALSATLLAAGASPERAATGMKNFLNALTRGASVTKRQSEVFEELGLDSVELAERMQVDARGAILSVVEAFGEVDAARRNAAIGDLFGQEAMGAITPLIDNIDSLREAFAKVEDEGEIAGAMMVEFARQSDTAASDLTLVKNSAQALAVAAGTVLLPMLRDALDVIVPLAQSIAAWAASNEGAVQSIFTLAGGLTALRVAAVAHPVLALITGIATGALLIYQNWDGIVAWFEGLVDGVTAAVSRMVTAVRTRLESMIPDWLKEAWDWVSGENNGGTVGSVARRAGRAAAARALGGPVRSGVAYRWQEEGQELFMPSVEGRVISAPQVEALRGRAQGLSRPSVTFGDVHVHAAPGMSESELAARVREELRRLLPDPEEALHDGGLYAG